MTYVKLNICHILYSLSNLSFKYNFEIIFNSLMLSSDTLNEYSFLAGANIAYFIAFNVPSLISTALLSCFPHVSHFSPLSLKLKYFIFYFSPQFTHFSICGLNPNMLIKRNLNMDITKSKFLSVSEITYTVFNSN